MAAALALLAGASAMRGASAAVANSRATLIVPDTVWATKGRHITGYVLPGEASNHSMLASARGASRPMTFNQNQRLHAWVQASELGRHEVVIDGLPYSSLAMLRGSGSVHVLPADARVVLLDAAMTGSMDEQGVRSLLRLASPVFLATFHAGNSADYPSTANEVRSRLGLHTPVLHVAPAVASAPDRLLTLRETSRALGGLGRRPMLVTAEGALAAAVVSRLRGKFDVYVFGSDAPAGATRLMSMDELALEAYR